MQYTDSGNYAAIQTNIPLTVLQRSLSDLLTAKAATERKLAACKSDASTWAKQYKEQIERTGAAAEHVRAQIHHVTRKSELDEAAAKLGARPVCNYRVCYPFLTASGGNSVSGSGRFTEVLDLMERSEVLLQFFADALLLEEPLKSTDAFTCYLADGEGVLLGNRQYVVEVL